VELKHVVAGLHPQSPCHLSWQPWVWVSHTL